jgi:hypothetical protein
MTWTGGPNKLARKMHFATPTGFVLSECDMHHFK